MDGRNSGKGWPALLHRAIKLKKSLVLQFGGRGRSTCRGGKFGGGGTNKLLSLGKRGFPLAGKRGSLRKRLFFSWRKVMPPEGSGENLFLNIKKKVWRGFTPDFIKKREGQYIIGGGGVTEGKRRKIVFPEDKNGGNQRKELFAAREKELPTNGGGRRVRKKEPKVLTWGKKKMGRSGWEDPKKRALPFLVRTSGHS